MHAELDSINDEQGLYVLKAGDGFTCLGFTVALQKARAVQRWLLEKGIVVAPANPLSSGTAAGYADYTRIMESAERFCLANKTRCPIELVPQLSGLEGKRVEVVEQNGETRRFIVGKSTGWMPCHLEIKTRRSSGGCAVYGNPFRSVRVV